MASKLGSNGRRLAFGGALAGLILVGLAGADEKSNRPVYDGRTAALGAIELGKAGKGFFRGFFRRGWPTTRDYRDLTENDAQGASEDTVISLLTSNFGLPMHSSAYMQEVFAQGKARNPSWSRPKLALQSTLGAFGQLSGWTGAPNKFSPPVFEYRVGLPALAGSYKASQPKTQSWKLEGADKVLSLDAIGMQLWSQASYAGRQILESHHGDSKAPKVGRDAESGFYALCALSSALAKVKELGQRCVVDGGKLQGIRNLRTYTPTSPKKWFPHRFVAKISGDKLSYKADKQKGALDSQLFDLSALLLGLVELSRVTQFADKSFNAKSPGETAAKKLFSSTKFESFGTFAPFDAKSHELVLDTAGFVLTNMQRLHFDSDRRTFRSRSLKNPALAPVQALSIADAGLTLLALSRYAHRIGELTARQGKGRGDASLKLRLIRSKKYAATYARYLARWVRARIEQGLHDRYNIATKQYLAKQRSAGTQALAARGLLAAATLLNDKEFRPADKKSALEGVLLLMAYSEKSLWNPELKLYLAKSSAKSDKKKIKVEVFGQLAMIGVLRELALLRDDVRYLIRLKELVRSLRAKGFVSSETKRGGETGGDSDGDGIKAPGEAGFAPVILPFVHAAD